MHSAGEIPAEIARRLGRAASTISRELQRNRSRNSYWAVAAQKKADARRRQRPRICKLQRPEVRHYVQERLRLYWSPDEIAARSRADFSRDRTRHVSHQTIYAWIHAQEAAEAALKVYFAKPYCAWQRGTNEHTNGLIRVCPWQVGLLPHRRSKPCCAGTRPLLCRVR
jgi:IS30 family transposase